ncbi:hypothetical protein H2248_000046 [Termitomyces sp. 'cryptogamus']|nr:hypothetical protein H2248_000046 [Termitomyces sp. 'cryptogamus']
MQGTLGIDANLQNKLHALVKEIHTSPNSCLFKDPLNPSCSFHVQCKEPIRTQSKALPPIPHQQEELNVASSILRNLNPTGGLFDLPTTHTLALSAHPWDNSVFSTFYTWDQPTAPKPHTQQPPLCIDNNNQTVRELLILDLLIVFFIPGLPLIPTPPAPPSDASSSQDNAWSCLLSLETQAQLTQASLTFHIAELTGLHQTTEAVSLSFQALLKHLLLAPTTPPMPPADAE